MAWLSPTSGLSSSTPVTTTVIQNLAHDTQIWGASVDAGGNGLANLASITGASGALSITSLVSVLGTAAAGPVYVNFANNAAQAANDEIRLRLMPSSIFVGTPAAAPYITCIQTSAATSACDIAFGTFGGGIQFELLRLISTGVMKFGVLPPIYANNAAAITGGLTSGMVYRTNANPDTLCIVH